MKIGLYVILISFLVGCTAQKAEDENAKQLISFDLADSFQNIHKTGLFQSVKFVVLEDNVPINTIDDIAYSKKHYYLLDKDENQVLIYTTSGKFEGRIASEGKGPHEYLQLTDLFVDSLNRTLNLISSPDKKRLTYNLEGERLLQVQTLSKPYVNVIAATDGYAAYAGNVQTTSSSKNVWKLDSEMEEKRGFFEIKKSFESYRVSNYAPLSRYRDTIYYHDIFDRNVYRVGKDTALAYTFDFGHYNLQEVNSLGEWDRIPLQERLSKVGYLKDFQETAHFVIGKILFKGQMLLCLYNKTQKSTHVAALMPYDSTYFLPFGKIIAIDEQHIYTVISATSLQFLLKNETLVKAHFNQFENLKKRLSGYEITEYANPILAVYTLN